MALRTHTSRASLAIRFHSIAQKLSRVLRFRRREIMCSSPWHSSSPPVPGTLVYTPPAGTVPPAGENTLLAAFTPTDQADYTSANASVPLLVNPANAPQIQWPTPAPITYGTALSGTQLNAQGLTSPGTTAVSLASYYRVNAFQSDGSVFSTGGFDNNGNAFSSNLVGSSVTFNGQTFSLGAGQSSGCRYKYDDYLAPGELYLNDADRGSDYNRADQSSLHAQLYRWHQRDRSTEHEQLDRSGRVQRRNYRFDDRAPKYR